jgi:predicted NUDIX family NTP pyrophosphohydrolase
MGCLNRGRCINKLNGGRAGHCPLTTSNCCVAVEGEDPFTVAKREFEEELGSKPTGAFWELGELVQPSKKVITAWAVEGDFDVRELKSNLFEMEWPPKSSLKECFPEIDRAEWFTPTDAQKKILPGQSEFVGRLLQRIGFVEPLLHSKPQLT